MRSMSQARSESASDSEKWDGKISMSLVFPWSKLPLSVSQDDLKLEQESDPSLKGLLEQALPSGDVKDHAHCYIIQDGMLMRKWVPHSDSFIGDPIN